MQNKSSKSLLLILVILALLLIAGGCGGSGSGEDGAPISNDIPMPSPGPGDDGGVAQFTGPWMISDATVTTYQDAGSPLVANYVPDSASSESFEVSIQPITDASGDLYMIALIGDGVILSGVPSASSVTFSVLPEKNGGAAIEWRAALIETHGDYEKIDEDTYKYEYQVEPWDVIGIPWTTIYQLQSDGTLRYTKETATNKFNRKTVYDVTLTPAK